MIVILVLLILLVTILILYTRQDKFGKAPTGERLLRITNSPQFKNGKFQNISITPTLAEGYSMPGVIYKQLFKKAARRHPADMIPTIKTDLLQLSPEQDVLVWFGHSSYFIQINGKRLLVDPVFSGNASPLPGTNKAFPKTDVYTVDELPNIDYLFISHDHYDHLDYDTLIKLKSKTGKIICGLGVGAHLEHWGYPSSKILERDWYDKLELDDQLTVWLTPARHFSGRGFSRNNTLWCSFVLQTPTLKIFMGGDSGYDKHFAEIGDRFGPFDLAILDNGQYDLAWRHIHALPGEDLQAARDLKAKRLMPVHSSKFVMANHAWDDPLITISELNKDFNIPLVTPMIGEPINLKDEAQTFKSWWVGIK